MEKIPFAKPFLGNEEVDAARDVILSGWVTQGPKVKQFEDAFGLYVGSKYACAVSNCTVALHLALLAVGVKPGDAVITVSHSFVATANSIRYCGAEPVFVDIELDTFNMSAEKLEECLVKKCKVVNGKVFYGKSRVAAVMPVHQLGMPCDLNAILPVCRKFNLPVVEDAACAIGSEILFDKEKQWSKIGRPHGDIACFSFHPRKVIVTGEGGMLTTNNPEYDQKARLLRQHGMSVSDAVRHESKKIIFEEYVILGYNYRLTDIQAAIGIEQMKKIGKMVAERRDLVSLYQEKLKDIPWLKLTVEPARQRSNWQSYPVMILKDAPLGRDELMQNLLDIGISTRRGVMNIHQEPAYAVDVELKNSELARDSVILLPLFNGMGKLQLDRVIDCLKKVGK